MKNNAGRPKLSTFDRIQTLFWYDFVKSQVTKQLLSNCLANIKKLNISSISTPKRDLELKSLITLKTRLIGSSAGKKNGALDTEIFKHSQDKAFNSKNDVFTSSTDNKFGLPSEKSWNRYKVAKTTPTKKLEKLEIIFSGNTKAFKNGPCSLFKMMSSPDITEALDLFKIELISILSNKEDIEISSKHSGNHFKSPSAVINELTKVNFSIKDDSDRYKLYNNILTSLQDEVGVDDIYPTSEKTIGGTKYIRNKFAHCDLFIHLSAGEAACLYLSLGFMGSRFFGDFNNLSRIANDICTLDVIEEYYAIPKSLWYEQNKENESFIIGEFLEVESLGYFERSKDNSSITVGYNDYLNNKY